MWVNNADVQSRSHGKPKALGVWRYYKLLLLNLHGIVLQPGYTKILLNVYTSGFTLVTTKSHSQVHEIVLSLFSFAVVQRLNNFAHFVLGASSK